MVHLKNQILIYGSAVSTFIAGVLHLALVPMYFDKMPTNVTIFFIIAGLAQLFWIIPVIKRWSNIWYYVGIGGTVILIILWIIAVPARGLTVSELEVVIEFFQIVFIILCLIIVKDKTATRLNQKHL
ncbi:MAG TPA: hypothetical protein VJ729_06125 [Nitrososphaeraceae archaeon]|nr:hypothetical protein [Nitrososphaeraceae archaeon]